MPEDDDSLEPGPLGDLAEEFLAGYRRGESPSVEDYAARHPHYAQAIRDLFPTLMLLEDSRVSGSLTPEGPGAAEIPGARGRRVGGYELVRELGRGGMGIVFEARDEALGRSVAVKVLPGSAVYDDRTRQRFLREARIVARLRHPHIVPIHAAGEEDGVLFYVMDLVRGTSLDQLGPGTAWAGSGPARARWVARLGLQAAETLAYAHREGVLHRDVKPSNFLLDEEGVLWLADFGLAKLIDDAPLTASGEWLGTLRYLAPECLRGAASIRSDVYGLGLTLYELLVGVPAFGETDRARLIQQIAGTAPVPPRRLDPTIPARLEAIVLKASERDPGRRYRTADEFADDLRRFLDGRPVRARRPGPVWGVRRWAGRHRGWIGLAGVVAFVLALAWALLLRGRTQTPVQAVAGGSGAPAASAGAAAAGGPKGSRAGATPRPTGPPWGMGRGRGPGSGGLGRGRGPHGPRGGMAQP